MHEPDACSSRFSASARVSRLRGRHAILAVALLLAMALLGGCSTAAGGGDAASAGSGSSGLTLPGYPVTVTDCGVRTTYHHPPRRVVTLHQQATEMLLALGLGNRMVGTAFRTTTILPKYRTQYQQIPELAGKYEFPSYEKLLQAHPDFVYSTFDRAFSAKAGRSRERLRNAGIKTYLSRNNCTDGPVTMQTLWAELRSLGKIFHVEGRAGALIRKSKAELATAKRKLAGVDPASVFVYAINPKAPLTEGGHAISSEILRRAGGRNIFADNDKQIFSTSWEQVIQRRPEWILITGTGGAQSESVQQKKQTLLSKPGLAHVPAITHHRFAVLSQPEIRFGIRAPASVAKLARQLHPGRFHS
jgi:iron complex transport system substrate-binding protein